MFERLWSRRTSGRPLKTAVTLFELQAAANVSASLFDEDRRRADLADAMDDINGRLGGSGIRFGGMLGVDDRPDAITPAHQYWGLKSDLSS
jgi:hypothetical protein